MTSMFSPTSDIGDDATHQSVYHGEDCENVSQITEHGVRGDSDVLSLGECRKV
jgi:hypothetical protein